MTVTEIPSMRARLTRLARTPSTWVAVVVLVMLAALLAVSMNVLGVAQATNDRTDILNNAVRDAENERALARFDVTAVHVKIADKTHLRVSWTGPGPGDGEGIDILGFVVDGRTDHPAMVHHDGLELEATTQDGSDGAMRIFLDDPEHGGFDGIWKVVIPVEAAALKPGSEVYVRTPHFSSPFILKEDDFHSLPLPTRPAPRPDEAHSE